ncbi:hypothetical protein HHL19_16150 [Streptomyces sp. R302]|uniref:hypothetical protein n=1 Tax=unclassified Streptomyces TaxID=2593676 RepID=UPI00145F00C6|nr:MULTISPECIES: hypothetical protein [unclassified Streptomyces]NML55305.1 hypothetical protein [Streptomyces sp. R301]NML80177.1 hypothetical protein [Streptomyces sp. R302]
MTTGPSHLQIVLIALGFHAAGSLLLIKLTDAESLNPLPHIRAAIFGRLLTITTFPTISTQPPDRRSQ